MEMHIVHRYVQKRLEAIHVIVKLVTHLAAMATHALVRLVRMNMSYISDHTCAYK